MLKMLVCRRYGQRSNNATLKGSVFQALKTINRKDKIPLRADSFKAMRHIQDKRLKKRGCWVIMFSLYSPPGFKLDPQDRLVYL